VIRFVDKDNKPSRSSGPPSESQRASGSELDESYQRLQPEMRRPKPSAEAIAAALEAAQRLASEADAEDAAGDMAHDLAIDSTSGVCRVCGYRNRGGNKFCGMCGLAVTGQNESEATSVPQPARRPSRAIALHPNPFLDPEPEPEPEPETQPQQTPYDDLERRPAPSRPSGLETHHYHHHYHHHYFPGGQDGMAPRLAGDVGREAERSRSTPTAALRGDMSRAEAAVRRITQEWVLACNTKHLDDLLDLYIADALVLRSNYPPVRGAAAVREFFLGALDAGLGEVEVEPLRVEIAGDMAYEAGRCKALVPSASGKRREERGKYLWVCARQSNGEWKLAVDCWSSDLALSTMESDVPASGGVRSSQPRKTP
jgi:ketosteroid isomerase-like protein